MKLSEIIKIIENEYPPHLAYEWDNPGLFCGDREKDIKKAVVSLDMSADAVVAAVDNGAELILSHHPVVIDAIKTLSDNTMASKVITEAIRHDIALYSAHTNMDTAKDGINQKLCGLFGLSETEVLEKDKPDEGCGLGRVGYLAEKMTLFELCELTKKLLKTPFVRVSGEDREVRKIAVASGSCSEYIPRAIEKGCGCIITADMKYHNAAEYAYQGIAVIDAGHYPTENIVLDMFSGLLKDTGVEIIKNTGKDAFRVI